MPSPLTPLNNLRIRLMEVVNSLQDPGLARRRQFHRDRQSAEYQRAFTTPNPLVTVSIATYNRGPLLFERSIPSILRQDYPNFECIVIGDCCTDGTAERMKSITDPRVRFENLAERGKYPDHPRHRWMVAGSVPANRSLELARGEFITHLDDDDEHPPDRLSKLVRFAQERRLDFVWHPFEYELASGEWAVNHAPKFARNQVTTSSILFHRWLGSVRLDLNAWRYNEPGDWNRFRKYRFLGVNAARHPDLLLKHYKERNQGKK